MFIFGNIIYNILINDNINVSEKKLFLLILYDTKLITLCLCLLYKI
jgi:hypothetical protein